jgi:amino acid transporter
MSQLGGHFSSSVVPEVSQLHYRMGNAYRLASDSCFLCLSRRNNPPEHHTIVQRGILPGWAVLAFSVVINTVGSKTLAHFEGVILIVHILGFFAILIPLVYLAPHHDASILTTFVNSGGWSTQGLSLMVGLPSSVFALVGTSQLCCKIRY